MNQIISTILNYVWVFIKILLFSAAMSLPFIGVTYFLQKPFDWLRTKKKLSFSLSLFITIFCSSFIILIFVYFLPILDKFARFTFLEGIAFFFLQIARLLLVNLLFSGMIFIIAMFIVLLYDSFKEKKKTKTKAKQKSSFLKLWKAFTMVFFVVFLFVFIIFPKIFAIILYLIFM